jgi:PAS domain S-box-containing protein
VADQLAILIIENDRIFRRVLKTRLAQHFDAAVRVIGSGEGALDILRTWPFDAIVARAEQLNSGPLVERLGKFGFHSSVIFFQQRSKRRVGHICTYIMRIHFGRMKKFLPRFVMNMGQYFELQEPAAEVQERYRKLINRMSDGYWELNPEGTILYANDPLKRILGRDELRGVKASSLFPRRDARRLEEVLEQQSRGILIPFTLDVVTPGGETHELHVDPTPYFDGKGKYLGSCAIISDITANPRIDESLRKSIRERDVLFRVTSALASAADPEDTLEGALGKILDELDMESGGLYLYDLLQSRFHLKYHRGISESDAAELESLPWAREFIDQITSRRKKVVLVRDFLKDPRLLDSSISREGYKSFALAPLISHSQIIGILWVLTRNRKKLDRDVGSLLISLGNQVGLALDNARYIAERLEQAKKQRQFSRDMIMSVTGGKLVLCEKDEIDLVWEGGEFQDGLTIRDAQCVGDTRRLVENVGGRLGFDEDRIFDMAISVSEVATNVVKHAGGGEITLQTKGPVLQIRIEDRGPGIDSVNLPRALLMKGFSTKTSLGIGYTIVLELMDKLHLATSSEGTTLVMEARMPCAGVSDPLAQFTGMFCDDVQALSEDISSAQIQ